MPQEERKQAKRLSQPTVAGDIAPQYTWVWFEFLSGQHVLIQMKPEDSTRLFTQWRTCIEERREMLFHVIDSDLPYQEFLFDSKRLGYIRVLDDAHGWPLAKAEIENYEGMILSAKARATGLVVGTAPPPKLEVAK